MKRFEPLKPGNKTDSATRKPAKRYNRVTLSGGRRLRLPYFPGLQGGNGPAETQPRPRLATARPVFRHPAVFLPALVHDIPSISFTKLAGTIGRAGSEDPKNQSFLMFAVTNLPANSRESGFWHGLSKAHVLVLHLSTFDFQFPMDKKRKQIRPLDRFGPAFGHDVFPGSVMAHSAPFPHVKTPAISSHDSLNGRPSFSSTTQNEKTVSGNTRRYARDNLGRGAKESPERDSSTAIPIASQRLCWPTSGYGKPHFRVLAPPFVKDTGMAAAFHI